MTAPAPATPGSAPTVANQATAPPSLDAEVLRRSFATCAQITKTRAGNFYHGLKLLGQPKRSAMYALYAWMRAVDDLADEPDNTINAVSDKQQRLALFRTQTQQACRAELDLARLDARHADIWPAIQQTFVTYQMPLSVLLDMIEGQLNDQRKTRYATWAELEEYCYQVAGTVGLACLCIWGYQGDEATRQLAIKRGLALQLTNILRDIVEDAQRDRLYLPAEQLRQHGIDPERFLTELRYGRPSISPTVFTQMMQVHIDRAEGYYQASRGLEKQLEADSRCACWAMAEIYRELLRCIAKKPEAVLQGRVSVSRWRKLGIGLKAKLGRPWAAEVV